MTMREEQSQQPSLFQIVVADVRIYQFFSLAVLAASFGIILSLVAAYALAGLALLLAALVFAALLAWRVHLFRSLLRQAIEVSGTVESVRRPKLASRGRFRHRITYTYSYQGRSYAGMCRLSMPIEALTVQPGDRVTVLVSSDMPQRSLIPILYM